MKYIFFILLLIFMSVIYLLHINDYIKSNNWINNSSESNEDILSEIGSFNISTKFDLTEVWYERIPVSNVKLTGYNNHTNQTDDTPNISASNRLVYEGQVALSRDLIQKYSLKYGDIIYIKKLKTFKVYEDKLNSRFSNQIDIFMFSKMEAMKMNTRSDIIIFKIKK